MNTVTEIVVLTVLAVVLGVAFYTICHVVLRII